MRPRKIAILVLLLIVAFSLVTCGGFVQTHSHDFGGQRDVDLDPGLEADLWLAPTERSLGLPGVFVRRTFSASYGVRLQVWDSTAWFRKLTVTEVVATYADGTQERHRDSRVFDFGTWAGGLSVSAVLPDVVARHAEHELVITGYLTESDGERVPFTVRTRKLPQSRSRLESFMEYYLID